MTDTQQIKQVGYEILETALERQGLAHDLFPAPPLIILSGDLKIIVQKFDEWEVGKGLAVRHRERLQHQTAEPRAFLELMKQPRLPDSGLAYNRDDLTVARFGLLERLMQVVELDLTADERGQSAMCRQLQACTQCT
ncbi:hypothetical protein D9M71_249170 [compost metagenome]